MKRTTLNLSDELDAQLRHEAGQRGIATSELVREALESHPASDTGEAATR